LIEKRFGDVGEPGDFGHAQKARHTFDAVEHPKQSIHSFAVDDALLCSQQNHFRAVESLQALGNEVAK